ncbi:protein ENHANCED DOWNY MILDEW 2-like isoform X2 [Camellia sinensis]|nr:protein ENHANCED DOWNY MILDEW 2-like isoform X2 [Camellia sinensis]
MPWTPTSEFPHPFSRVKQEVGYRLSYQIVDALIWLGIWDIINEFRKKKLKLRPVTYLSGSYSSPDVPYGYLWSPHLVPKPKVCRHCSKSHHRKCLPGNITFEDLEDEGILQRAWEGLIPNRILIYYLEHEIDDEIRTPSRNHIKFPDDGQNKERQALELLLSKRKVLQKERALASTDASRKRTLGKV